MKKKLTIILSTLLVCFGSVSCTMDWQPIYTIYTDIWSYSDYKYVFKDYITDGYYQRLEMSEEDWDDVGYIFEDGTKHFYNREQITDWFIAHDFGEEEAEKETAWLTIVEHGLISARAGDFVYLISK